MYIVRASEIQKGVKVKSSDDSDNATSDSSPGFNSRGRPYDDSYACISDTSQAYNLTFNGMPIDNHVTKRARIGADEGRDGNTNELYETKTVFPWTSARARETECHDQFFLRTHGKMDVSGTSTKNILRASREKN
jgi:hypothetical protein